MLCVYVVVFGVVCVCMKQVQAAKKKAEGEDAKGDKALTSPVKKKGKQTKFRANKEQDLVAKSLHTGPKGMPKRMGPKIRHRNRGKGDKQVQAGKAKKGKKWRQNQPKKQQPKPKVCWGLYGRYF